jgi:alkylated DNA nucleotide flippase Atl1
MPPRKFWQEKLENDNGLPKVERITPKMSPRWGKGTFVIPAPREVDAIMKQVPKGKLITIDEIRRKLAATHKATIACPITTGIFAWIAAHAAAEAEAQGAQKITPFWRTLKTGGEVNPKYPGGIDDLRERLEDEGHTVVQKGKRFLVEGYEAKMVGSPQRKQG